MKREKQIEEMARDLNFLTRIGQTEAEIIAGTFYTIGYRKQSDGEWELIRSINAYVCSACTKISPHQYAYCPHCGAKMKGGERSGS